MMFRLGNKGIIVDNRVFSVFGVFFLTLIFMGFFHLLDIGQIIGYATDWSGTGCNGFWCLSDVILYHAGMYGMVFCHAVLASWFIFVILVDKKGVKK